MAIKKFHDRNVDKRGGEISPSRLFLGARRGVTLVELMISMLILTIVCIAWLQIIGIQSARKEARRREAVERLVGMMDAYLYVTLRGNQNGVNLNKESSYSIVKNGDELRFVEYRTNAKGNKEVYPMFDTDVSSVGYRIELVKRDALPDMEQYKEWTTGNNYWLVGRLYNRYGNLDEVGAPFFSLPVCLGY